MGSVGARRVVTVDAGITPPASYKVTDNPECLLDKTDLVFVDPIGTGFSHAAGKAQDKDFWGVDQDVKSLAQFITIYVTRNNRWNSPKFLEGRCSERNEKSRRLTAWPPMARAANGTGSIKVARTLASPALRMSRATWWAP